MIVIDLESPPCDTPINPDGIDDEDTRLCGLPSTRHYVCNDSSGARVAHICEGHLTDIDDMADGGWEEISLEEFLVWEVMVS
jgi:hypothetical protein